MRKSYRFWTLAGILATILSAGCGSGDSGSLTKDQEDALRHHPAADPNFKGPSKEDTDKMNASLKAYAEQHKNDKVGFSTGK